PAFLMSGSSASGGCRTEGALCRVRADADHVADCKNKIGPVHRVEMEIPYPALHKVEDLLSGDSRGDQGMCLRIVFQPLKAFAQPGGHMGSRPGRKIRHLAYIVNR